MSSKNCTKNRLKIGGLPCFSSDNSVCGKQEERF